MQDAVQASVQVLHGGLLDQLLGHLHLHLVTYHLDDVRGKLQFLNSPLSTCGLGHNKS